MPREKSASSEGLRRSSRVSDGLGSQGSLYCTQEPNEPDVIEGAAPLIRAVGGDSTEGGAGGEIQSAADSGKATKARKRGVTDTPSSAVASSTAAPTPTASGTSVDTSTGDEDNATGNSGGLSSNSIKSPPAEKASGTEVETGATADGRDGDGSGSKRSENGGDAGDGTDTGAAAPSTKSRREAWAKVARTRGAHFARPDRSNASSASRRSSGSASAGAGAEEDSKESWPGPFAEARRLLKNRDAAAAEREERRVNGKATGDSDDAKDGETQRAAAKVEWKPRGRGSRVGKWKDIPSLFSLCLDLLADNFDHVESLGDVSPQVRNHLAGVLCRQLKLTTETLQRLSEPGVTELILPDCSRIEPDQMKASLFQCRESIRVLRLGTCGRCVGDETLSAIARAGGFPRLEIAALAGTYQLTSVGVLKLLDCCPKLTGLELPANSRIDGASIEAMVDGKRPEGRYLKALSLADCFQLGPAELNPLKHMAHLESLALDGVAQVTDETLAKALDACGGTLRHLSVSDCPKITDKSIRLVGERCGILESLSLGMCPLLSSLAVQEIFQYSGSATDLAGANGTRQANGDQTFDRIQSGSSVSNGSALGKGEINARTVVNGKWKGKGKARRVDPLDDDDDDDMDNDEDGDGGVPKGDDGKTQETQDTPVDYAAPTAVRAGTCPANSDSVRGRQESGKGRVVGGNNGEAVADAPGAGGAGDGHAMLKSRLTSVSLRGLVAVDDAAVMAMAAACSNSLRHLDLKGVALVTDNSMVALARYCSSSLESLDLSFCRSITDDGLGHLVDACPRLRSLRLWGCTQITDRFLRGHSRQELVLSRY